MTIKKKTFLNLRKKFPKNVATKLEGEGEGINGRATKKITFFAASLRQYQTRIFAIKMVIDKMIRWYFYWYVSLFYR